MRETLLITAQVIISCNDDKITKITSRRHVISLEFLKILLSQIPMLLQLENFIQILRC